jgi:hypothetical protein
MVSTVSMQSVISMPFMTMGAPSMLDMTTPMALSMVDTNWLFCKLSLLIFSSAERSMTKGAILMDLMNIFVPSLGMGRSFHSASLGCR